ncbi:DinB family protein [Quadrisphaera oryzae]|uniref:DinB family protein n=1 Tax=Quadrisphaera TaxID=317661 RepID=UPI001C95711E
MDTTTTEARWPEQALEQLTWHWEGQVRPRLEGLTDAELHWEPVPGCWGVRPQGTSSAPMSAGGGDWACDFGIPEPQPAPFTTIAWRLAHLTVGVFGQRAASHFGYRGPGSAGYLAHDYAGTADEALAQLDAAHAAWTDGVRSLAPSAWARPVGEAEGEWAAHPMSSLVLHITREAVHHGAEVCLLRDLWLHRAR